MSYSTFCAFGPTDLETKRHVGRSRSVGRTRLFSGRREPIWSPFGEAPKSCWLTGVLSLLCIVPALIGFVRVVVFEFAFMAKKPVRIATYCPAMCILNEHMRFPSTGRGSMNYSGSSITLNSWPHADLIFGLELLSKPMFGALRRDVLFVACSNKK